MSNVPLLQENTQQPNTAGQLPPSLSSGEPNRAVAAPSAATAPLAGLPAYQDSDFAVLGEILGVAEAAASQELQELPDAGQVTLLGRTDM